MLTSAFNCDEGVFILWPFFWGNVIFKICHFCLKSHNAVPNIFHDCLTSPGKTSALALKNEDNMNKEKHSLRSVTISKKFIPTSIVTFDTKEANFENNIASEKWL